MPDPIVHTDAPRLQGARAIVFFASFCLMTIELIAGRVMAPFLGVSLDTWTSVIGMVMVGVTLGNYLGGRLADRVQSHAWLGICFVLAGIATIFIRLLASPVGSALQTSTWPLWLSSLVFTLFVFFPAAFFLSMVSPQVVKFDLHDLEKTGATIGTIGAWSAIGSIAGTLLTGFVFLMFVGNKVLIALIASLLVLIGLLVAGQKRIFQEKKINPTGDAEAPTNGWHQGGAQSVFAGDNAANLTGDAETGTPLAPQTQSSTSGVFQRQDPSPANEVTGPVRDQQQDPSDNRRLLVFGASFCLMAVEIVAGRLIAPYLGVSVYTWTSVIGTVLLGVSAGNYVGGALADRFGSRTRLGITIAWAGFAVLLISYLAPLFGDSHFKNNFPLYFQTLLFSLIVIFPAAFLLSTVTPQIMKIGVRASATVGKDVGTLYAWSALGSIAGTLLAGYVLIAWIGTKMILLLVACALLIAGIAVARPYRLWKQKLSVVMVLFLVGDLFLPSPCKVETNYFCVRVFQQSEDGVRGYVLRLDHLIHSYVFPDAPDHVGYGYEHVYTNLIAYKHAASDSFSALFIGGGGYTLPRYLEKLYPGSEVVVAEIDPGVTRVNTTLMELPTNTRIKTVNEDARIFLNRLSPEVKYDLVFGDAFNDFSVPYHLTTDEFHRLLKAHMTENGVYALNIIDDARYGKFFSAMTKTLKGVWKHVYVAPQTDDIAPGRNTIILLATDAEIDRTAWNGLMPQIAITTDKEGADWQRWITLLPQEKVDAFVAAHPAQILTDDFAPTDRYLAPVFHDAY